MSAVSFFFLLFLEIWTIQAPDNKGILQQGVDKVKELAYEAKEGIQHAAERTKEAAHHAGDSMREGMHSVSHKVRSFSCFMISL